MEKVIACLETVSIYNYVHRDSDGTKELKRALDYLEKDIERLKTNIEKYPDNHKLPGILEKDLRTHYEIVTLEKFFEAEKEHYLGKPLKKITGEVFNEMLNVLPPICWVRTEGLETFCISEMLTGSYTSQYARMNNDYYTKTVDCKDRKTWITKNMINDFKRKENEKLS